MRAAPVLATKFWLRVGRACLLTGCASGPLPKTDGAGLVNKQLAQNPGESACGTGQTQWGWASLISLQRGGARGEGCYSETEFKGQPFLLGAQ